MQSYLNAPEHNKSPELGMIFHQISLIGKQEVTHPFRFGLKFQIMTFHFFFFFKKIKWLKTEVFEKKYWRDKNLSLIWVLQLPA